MLCFKLSRTISSLLLKNTFVLANQGNRLDQFAQRTITHNNQLNKNIQYAFAKMSKKEQEKKEKKKEKQQAKQAVGGESDTIDLDKFEQAYLNIIQKYKEELTKLKVGRMDVSLFESLYVRVANQNLPISQLAQISSKNVTTCIISPFQFENLDAIEKVLKANDQNYDVAKIQKSLSVSQPNSSAKELKEKLIQKLKKISNDKKEELKHARSKNMDQLKKYKKIAQEDKYKIIEKELKAIFDKRNEEIDKLQKEKEKELQK